MSSTELVLGGTDPLAHAKSIVAGFMGHKFVRSNWDQIFEEVSAGKVSSEKLIAELKAFEPVAKCPPVQVQHEIWLLEQRLRLALRHEKGKRLHTKVRCGACGNPTHFFDDTQYSSCLPCSEIAVQYRYQGSRGSTKFLRPTYDAATRSWGILLYNAFYHPDRIEVLFFAALGWPTYDEVLENGLLPWALFWRWQWSFYESMSDSDSFPLRAIAAGNPPFSPTAWRAFTEQKLIENVQEEGISWI